MLYTAARLCSCSLLFFTAAHFHLVGRSLLAASISHCLTAALNFRVFFLQTSSLLFSITRSSSFSVIPVSVNIKNNVEKDKTLLLLFLSKSPGGHAISFQIKPWVALRLPYLLIELFTLVCLWCGWTLGRSGGRMGGFIWNSLLTAGLSYFHWPRPQ